MAKAKKKKRVSKKVQQKRANATLFIMLAVIFIIIGIFVFKAINKDEKAPVDTTTSTEYVFVQGDSSSDDDSSDDDTQAASENETQDDSETTAEADSTSTTEEKTTEMLTLPINNEPESMVDLIINHYTDYMGFPEGALFINESETDETASSYTYALRLNASGAPNKLVGDIHVEKGTGKVTDSMGNEPWYISD